MSRDEEGMTRRDWLIVLGLILVGIGMVIGAAALLAPFG